MTIIAMAMMTAEAAARVTLKHRISYLYPSKILGNSVIMPSAAEADLGFLSPSGKRGKIKKSC